MSWSLSQARENPKDFLHPSNVSTYEICQDTGSPPGIRSSNNKSNKMPFFWLKLANRVSGDFPG